jgi:hypothetical protein
VCWRKSGVIDIIHDPTEVNLADPGRSRLEEVLVDEAVLVELIEAVGDESPIEIFTANHRLNGDRYDKKTWGTYLLETKFLRFSALK